MADQIPQGPLDRGLRPPCPSQAQQPPGLESEMRPRPDFGAKSYVRHGRLQGKAAIIAFTVSLAQQLIKQGIRVNAVAPGPVWTPLIVSSKPPELLRKQEQQPISFGSDNPEQRPAQPAELAPAYVFLASPEASYVNGCVLSVAGGEPMPSPGAHCMRGAARRPAPASRS